MKNREIIETLMMCGTDLKLTEREIKELDRSSIDIKEAYRDIARYFSRDNQKMIWDTIVGFARLENRHKLHLSINEFVRYYLNLFKLKYDGTEHNHISYIINDLKLLNKETSYRISLRELKLVNGARCVRLDGAKFYYRDALTKYGKQAILTASNKSRGVTASLITVKGKEIVFVRDEKIGNMHAMETILKGNYDVAYSPSLKLMQDDLFKLSEYFKVDNRSFILMLRLIKKIELHTKSDLLTLDRIESSRFNYRDTIIELLRIHKMRTSEFIRLLGTIDDSLVGLSVAEANERLKKLSQDLKENNKDGRISLVKDGNGFRILERVIR